MNDSAKIMEFLRKHKTTEQTRIVLHHLFFKGPITQDMASRYYGITRLAAVIWKLRHIYGFFISDSTENTVNRYGVKTTYSKYSLS